MDAGSAHGPARVRITSEGAGADPRWERFVASQPGGDLVQSTIWAATKQEIGQLARLTVAVDASGDVVGGALLVLSSVAPGVRVGYVARGPVTDPTVDRRLDLVEALLRHVVRDAAAHRCRLLIVQPPVDLPDPDGVLAPLGFREGAPSVAPEATILLDVQRGDEALLADMSSMRRRNVRKVMRSPLAVEESEDVGLFHRLHVSSATRQGFEPRSLAYLRSQWSHLRPSGAVSILVAVVDGAPVAGIWITRFGGVVTYRLPGWDATGGAPNVNEALHWAAVQRARAAGDRVYDLGGFDRAVASEILAGREPDDSFRRSAGFFKLGFCATPVLLPRARWIVPGRVLRGPASPMVARALRSPLARRVADRMRNG